MTRWYCGFWISLAILFVSVTGAIILTAIRYKRKWFITPTRVLFVGTFLASCFFLSPGFFVSFSPLPFLRSAFLSMYYSFRLFALDGEFISFQVTANSPEGFKTLLNWYVFMDAFLHVWAPLLTFSFILSFFKNLTAHLRYLFFFWVDTHVFSELNEKTLALAKDITKRNKRIFWIIPTALIVFTDILDKKEESTLDLIEEARENGAILFRKDLESIRYRHRRSLRNLSFYLISEDESEKLRHAKSILDQYDYDKKVKLYIFSDDTRCELFLETYPIHHINVTLIDDIQSLIYHNLYSHGHYLFKRARTAGRNKKVISVILVGLGRYGREMLKALTWFCQLNGSIPEFHLKINVFDADERACEKFTTLCPELMDKKHNGKFKQGDAGYEITIHNGIDVNTPEFDEKISTIKDATYIFVSLGNDETNLSVSTRIRSICERTEYLGDSNQKPDIETIIYNSRLRKLMCTTWEAIVPAKSEASKKIVTGIKNFKNQPYNILMFGDLDSFYSVETLIGCESDKATNASPGTFLWYDGRDVNRRYGRLQAKTDYLTDVLSSEWKEKRINKEAFENYRKEKIGDALVAFLETYHLPPEKLSRKDGKPTVSQKETYRNEKKQYKTVKHWQKGFIKARPHIDLTKEPALLSRYYEKHPLKGFTPNEREIWTQFVKSISKESAWNAEIEEKLIHWKNPEGWESFVIPYDYKSDISFRGKYAQRSSIAKALHEKLRKNLHEINDIKMKVKGCDALPIPTVGEWERAENNLSSEDINKRTAARNIEHVRWNAYMRTEGYRYAGVRNDMAKQHPDLVPTKCLDETTLSKDD